MSSANATPRSVTIPAPYVGMSDATLTLIVHDERATMFLSADDRTIAIGEGFRRPEIGALAWADCPDTELADVFGSFLAHALESDEEGARDAWPLLTEEASDWTDALGDFAERAATVDVWGCPENVPDHVEATADLWSLHIGFLNAALALADDATPAQALARELGWNPDEIDAAVSTLMKLAEGGRVDHVAAVALLIGHRLGTARAMADLLA